MNRTKRQWVFYGLLASSLLILLAGWWLGSNAMFSSGSGQLTAIGRLFGLLATASILLEVLLMSRLPFMETTFDLQENIDLHRLNGYAVLLSISGHIAFLVVGYANPLRLGYLSQFWSFVTKTEDVLWATLGTIVFFVATGLSVKIIRSKLRYEWWYAIHLTIYGAILLTFLHQVKIGGDFLQQRWFLAFWYGLYILIFGLLGYYRFLRPCWYLYKYQFKVHKIVPEADNIYSVYVTGKNVDTFKFQPGQYATWRFLNPQLWFEGHPFSFSDRPGQNTLRFTAKASGDFSTKLASVAAGTPIFLDGPRGSFTPDRVLANDVVLVAGGIGVAPYLSLLHGLIAEGKKVTLLYAARKPSDIAFRNELIALRNQGLMIQTFMSDDNKFVDQSVLAPYKKIKDVTVYICGPDIMAKLVTKALKELGFRKEQIISERFAF